MKATSRPPSSQRSCVLGGAQRQMAMGAGDGGGAGIITAHCALLDPAPLPPLLPPSCPFSPPAPPPPPPHRLERRRVGPVGGGVLQREDHRPHDDAGGQRVGADARRLGRLAVEKIGWFGLVGCGFSRETCTPSPLSHTINSKARQQLNNHSSMKLLPHRTEPVAATGCRRIVSSITALRYGSRAGSRSSNPGWRGVAQLPAPACSSPALLSSDLTRRCTSGCAAMLKLCLRLGLVLLVVVVLVCGGVVVVVLRLVLCHHSPPVGAAPPSHHHTPQPHSPQPTTHNPRPKLQPQPPRAQAPRDRVRRRVEAGEHEGADLGQQLLLGQRAAGLGVTHAREARPQHVLLGFIEDDAGEWSGEERGWEGMAFF